MDWSNLSRNFEEEPLKKISNKLEDLSYKDLSYLVENFSFCDITKILKISDNYLRRQLKIHNLKTKIDHRRKYPKRTIEEKEIDKYGKLGLTHKEKLQITYKKYPEIKNTAIKNFKKTWKNRTKEEEALRQTRIKQTKLEKYGDENYTNNAKRKITNIKHYGCISPLLTKESLVKSHSKEAVKKANKSRKQTWRNKSIEEKKKIYENIRETNMKRYGHVSHTQDPEWIAKHVNSLFFGSEKHLSILDDIQRKRQLTMYKNGTLNTSHNFEDMLVQYLKDTYPQYTILTQYNEDPRYPYMCDCYIKELDLFIEFQGSYFHNWRPFDYSAAHIKEYEEMIAHGGQKETIANVWRYKDTEKRECAKRNNLNYLEYWEKLIILPEEIRNNQNNLILYYQQKLFYAKNREELFDPIKRWEYYKNAIEYSDFYKRHSYVSHLTLLRRPYFLHQIGYSSFNIKLCEIIDKKYSVYDPCGGWGHRLLGFKNHKQYIYNDISLPTLLNCEKLAKDQNITNCKFYNQDAALPIQDEYDVVFTCPPYFNKEIFTSAGAENYTEKQFIEWWNEVLNNLKPKTGEIYIVINSNYLKYFVSNDYKYEIVNTSLRKSHYHKNTKESSEIIVKFNKGI